MSSPSFPKECFVNVYPFLDKSTIYNCLFVNKYLCRLTVPMIWKDPFRSDPKPSLIGTLFACRNKDEEDKYFPPIFRTIKFNDQTPLFEYGRFVKIIDMRIAWILSELGLVR